MGDDRRLRRFLLLAFLGPVLAAVVLRGLLGDAVHPALGTFVVALAMPAPLVAALLVSGERPAALVRRLWEGARARPAVSLLLPAVTGLAWSLLCVLLVLVLGDLARIPGVGSVLVDTATLAERLEALGAAPDGAPAVLPLLLTGLLAGALAGLTINALFALGEEHGWRGWLHDHLLARVGPFRTVLVTGVVWGLWHAPLIVAIGLNYPGRPVAGVLAMMLFTTAASWPLFELRMLAGTALAPAVLHGGVNGTAGVLVIATGGDALLGAPVGVLGAVAFLPVGAALRARRRAGLAVAGSAPAR